MLKKNKLKIVEKNNTDSPQKKHIQSIQEQRNKKEISELTFRTEINRYTLGLLEKKNYHLLNKLGKGAYGDVFSAIKPDKQTVVALKIVTTGKISTNEVLMWPHLRHPNILRLQETMFIPAVTTYVFVTPVQETTMVDILNNEAFRMDRMSLDKIKTWFCHILSGLQFLHEQKLCHLDLKTDNILISSELTAAIADFTFINTARIPTKRYGVPMSYCPPEAFTSTSRKAPVEGTTMDMWTMGILILNSLTRFTLSTDLIQHPWNWGCCVYPKFHRLLQLDNLRRCIQEALPLAEISEGTLISLRTFITMFLRLDTNLRPSAGLALTHEFLGGAYRSVPEYIWDTKWVIVTSFYVRIFVAGYHRRLNLYPVVHPHMLPPWEDTPMTVLCSSQPESEKSDTTLEQRKETSTMKEHSLQFDNRGETSSLVTDITAKIDDKLDDEFAAEGSRKSSSERLPNSFQKISQCCRFFRCGRNAPDDDLSKKILQLRLDLPLLHQFENNDIRNGKDQILI